MPKGSFLAAHEAVSASPSSGYAPVLVAGEGEAAKRCLKTLKKFKLPATVAHNWLKVLDHLEKTAFGVLLLEPDLKGLYILEGLRLVHKIRPHLVTLVLGPLTAELTAEVLAVGAEGVLPGDLPPEILADWVQSYRQRQRLRQENDRLRNRILETEAYLAHLLDQLEEAIITTDLAGGIVAANLAASQLFQVSPGKWPQLALQDLHIVGDGLSSLSEAVQRVLRDGVVEGRFLVALASGKSFPVYFRGAEYQREGRPAGTILVFRDLTAQEELELRVEESERLAALAQIASGMAHEIRNPLTIIGGLVKRCQRHLPPESPAHNYLPAVLENVRRMEAMVREIDEYLCYVRTAGERWGEVDLNAVIHLAVTRLKEVKDLKGIRLELPAVIPAELHGDETSLVEMLFQVLVNGVEAMPQGGVLRLETVQEGDYLSLRLSDTGQGITPDDLPNIALPFFTTKMTGAGMGLTKVYLIVSRHRGQIDVESRPGQGTTFIIRLPITK